MSLKKKSKEALATQATENVTMEADAEVPATHQHLQDLIQREATKIANKRIQQEIAAIRKAALGKKTRGAMPPMAPRKKNKRQPGKKERRGTDANADDASTNGTSNHSDDERDWTKV
jgi:uncharacterized protein YdaU (DUF1376 family)